MKGFQMIVSGNWGHFKKPETNNNPLTHDLMTKTAFIGMIGAVLGIERRDMRRLFPILSDELLYGVSLLSPVRKVSFGFTSKKAHKPTGEGTPKSFELLKNPSFKISLALKNNCSIEADKIFHELVNFIKEGQTIYTPVLGWHNCPAEIKFLNIGDFIEDCGEFSTNGFVEVGKHEYIKDYENAFRIGFDRMPTYQSDDFFNDPEKYVSIIYPDYPNAIKVKGPFYVFKPENVSASEENKIEACYLL